MAFIDVLNVGDGACSIIRCPSYLRCRCPPVIVDCGKMRGNQWEPGQTAAAALGSNLANLQTLVVTHFDLDHWGGLRELAGEYGMTVRDGRRSIQIVYPRLPEIAERIPAITLAFLTTATGTGVRATELIRAWRDVARVKVTTVPLWQGNTFDAGQSRWEVLWPPPLLPPQFSIRITKALDDADQLAADLEKAGHPALRDNLAEAYEVDGFLAGFERVRKSTEPAGADEGYPEPSSDEDWSESEPADDDRGEHEHPTEHRLDLLQLHNVPPELAERFRALARRIGPINNLLSLAFHTSEPDSNGGIVVLGDLQGKPLKHIVGAMRPRYHAMLAPHHGTVPLPPHFPSADICISQAGQSHDSRHGRHRATHADSDCVTTHSAGHIYARIANGYAWAMR